MDAEHEKEIGKLVDKKLKSIRMQVIMLAISLIAVESLVIFNVLQYKKIVNSEKVFVSELQEIIELYEGK